MTTFCTRMSLALLFMLIAPMLQLPVPAQEGRLEEIEVRSKALEDNLLGDSATRDVTVYLPYGYDTKPWKRYPVVYLLHGYLDKNRSWANRLRNRDLRIARIADKVMASPFIQPMIIVAPDCYNTFRGSWYTDSPVTGNWEDFVTRDLVHHMDAHYRTVRERAGRGIAGHGMGGHGAIKIAMKHPELYCCLYSMAPALTAFSEEFKVPLADHVVEAVQLEKRSNFFRIHPSGQALIALAAAVAPNPSCKPFLGELPVDAAGNRRKEVWEKWLKHDLATGMLATYGKNLHRYNAIYIDCGSQDPHLPMNIVFAEALRAAGINHSFEQFEGNHFNRVASQLEYKALPLFSVNLAGADSAPAVRDKIQIRFPIQKLSFTLDEVAEGVALKYEFVVTEDIENVIPQPEGASATMPGPGGLHPFERIFGSGQSYSPSSIFSGPGEWEPRTIKKGRYRLQCEWDGRNWTGPSDTVVPKGDPFPAGTYTLQVHFAGRVVTSSGEEPYGMRAGVLVSLKE